MLTDNKIRSETIKEKLRKKIAKDPIKYGPVKETYNLFKDPELLKRFNQLSPKTRKRYQKQGETMYKNMNVKEEEGKFSLHFGENEDGSSKTPFSEDDVKESRAYILSGLRSGMHPRELTANERELLTQYYKPNWYEEFGFTKEESYQGDAEERKKLKEEEEKKLEEREKRFVEEDNETKV